METNRKGFFSRKWIVAIVVYIGLVALCCIVVYAVPSVKGMLEKTYIAQNGTIDVKDEVSAFIVRDETVYAAAEKSKINRLADADKLVKADSRVVELTPTEEEPEEAKEEAKSDEAKDAKSEDKTDAKAKDNKDAKTEESEEETADKTGRYKSIMEELGDSVKVTEKGVTKDSGYVSYYVDGAEEKLSTDRLDGLTEKDLKELTGRKAVKVPEKHCGKGYPVFKIVRNSKWYLVFFEDNESAARYVEGETVTIDLNGEPVTVTVSRVDSGTKTSKIALSCKSFFDGFFEMRELATTVTFVSAEGLVIEDSSIVEAPDGKRGVFVKNKLGEHVFKPIRAKADDGTKCVVFADIYVDAEGNFVETVKTYDEIIAEPTEEDLASLEKAVQKEKESKEKESKEKESKEKESKEIETKADESPEETKDGN